MTRERRALLKHLREKARTVTKQTGVQHNIHHRRPTSLSGTDDDRNISIVPMRVHDAYHLLFSNLSPQMIAEVLTELWIDPDWEIVARKKFTVS